MNRDIDSTAQQDSVAQADTSGVKPRKEYNKPVVRALGGFRTRTLGSSGPRFDGNFGKVTQP
jgi:hypothetical protein